MDIVVALEHRFDRTPDGSVWTQTTFQYPFWLRYLDVFDHVRVVARVRDVPSVPEDWKCASGPDVSFEAIPYYIGLWQYLLRSNQIAQAARKSIHEDDALIVRIPSQVASCMLPVLDKTGHPYGAEVVADPYDVFAPGSVRHPLRPFFRWLFPQRLRQQCLKACAVSYVTRAALQHRYPPAESAFSTYYSDVELPDAAFAPTSRGYQKEQTRFILIHVGTMSQLYKAQDVLIDAIAICLQEGLDLKLTLVGDGQYRTALEAQVQRLGLDSRVSFQGQLASGAAVRSQLQQSDLFVLPSHQEGLPRAMVEAMAQGLPCIGSTVGGIPELLPMEDMVPPGDAIALAQKIREIVTCPERMVQQSARNLEKAHEYQEEHLVERRLAFYRSVRDQTEAWLKLKKS
jgi:glycosyltransferase involved in cell wall biosynthesis